MSIYWQCRTMGMSIGMLAPIGETNLRGIFQLHHDPFPMRWNEKLVNRFEDARIWQQFNFYHLSNRTLACDLRLTWFCNWLIFGVEKLCEIRTAIPPV